MTLFLIIIQGCTVAYYKTDDNLAENNEQTSNEYCQINYTLEIDAEVRQLTTGIKERNDLAEKGKKKYLAIADKVFIKQGCTPNHVENEENADFKIGIKISPYHSALPQEWLTGLSVGLIPSWGTRKNEYTYTFTNKTESVNHSYSVDKVSFNHLVVFPVFWTIFFTLDEHKTFEKALQNFIKNS